MKTMAQIKAFRGLRFNTAKAGDIGSLTCPPYDIISEEQRKAYLEANAPQRHPFGAAPGGEDPYQEAGRVLDEWKQEGILKRDEKESLYIYEEEFTVKGVTRKVKGVICLVKLTPFSEGVVLPHEFTLSKAKTDRYNLMKSTFCNFSQIYSLYMDEQHQTTGKLDRLSQAAPDIELADQENVTHRLWIITDETEIASICGDFNERKLYIADGHHRYETALNYRNWCRETGKAKEGDAVDYQMMMLVEMEHPGLVVFPTHRLVRDLKDFDAAKAMQACARYLISREKTGTETIEQELSREFQKGKNAFAFTRAAKNGRCLRSKPSAPIKELLPNASEATQGARRYRFTYAGAWKSLFGIDAENMAQQINLTYTKNL